MHELLLDWTILKLIIVSGSTQIRAQIRWPHLTRAKGGARVRYRLHLHKAIAFPLLRTRLPRTWRGCHSEFQDSPQSSFASAADQYSSLSSSAFLPPFSFFLDFKPPHSKHLHPCLRYLACIPAYYYTELRLHISSVTFACLF